MKAIINIFFKEGVLDSSAKAVKNALASLHYDGVEDLKISKQITLSLNYSTKAKAKEKVKDMCEQLLANTVIEDYDIKIIN